MSNLQDLSQQISKLIAEADSSASMVHSAAGTLDKTEAAIVRLIQGTAMRNYQDMLNHLELAKKKLAEAAESLLAASTSGNHWLTHHAAVAAGSTGSADHQFGGFSEHAIDAEPAALPAQTALSDYMSAHNYGKDDYAEYSQDPVWRVLHRAAFPNSDIPPLSRAKAYSLLCQFMMEHNYGIGDYGSYSKDPVWQELHRYAFPGRFERLDKSLASDGYRSIVDRLEASGIDYLPIQTFERYRTQEDIIARLGGGDNTRGSCSSLAFAYAGNIAGYDVLDFRDGESRSFFSKNSSIVKIAELPGVDSLIQFGSDDISCTMRLLDNVTAGKEYYLATGQHVAVIRKVEGHFEYLELQHPTNNGWHILNESVLQRRFGCERFQDREYPNVLIDIDSLVENQEFLGILGYLNTSEYDQHKGIDGYVR